jgi:hypothetical protein
MRKEHVTRWGTPRALLSGGGGVHSTGWTINQSINGTSVAMRFIEHLSQPFAENHLLVDIDLFHQPK